MDEIKNKEIGEVAIIQIKNNDSDNLELLYNEVKKQVPLEKFKELQDKQVILDLMSDLNHYKTERDKNPNEYFKWFGLFSPHNLNKNYPLLGRYSKTKKFEVVEKVSKLIKSQEGQMIEQLTPEDIKVLKQGNLGKTTKKYLKFILEKNNALENNSPLNDESIELANKANK